MDAGLHEFTARGLYREKIFRLNDDWDVIFWANLHATKLSRDFVEWGRQQRKLLALHLPIH